MDGNRRFAKNKKIETIQAHSLGFSTLIECHEWFRELGIRELTVYAFSTENLKRTKKERSPDLTPLYFSKCNPDPRKCKKNHGSSCEVTKDNNEFMFNVAFFYVARDEIAASIKSVVDGVQEGYFKCEDISEDLISLYSQFDKNYEMMIRTSGEHFLKHQPEQD
uniref:ditrans,polycis-polyprenyl diphosphate synthase [(2E,6E)-farnesyldiphosphate specific] n=1 Tax=Diabrotica virgifera virgifera TaxID=50390 RepID=A0A6P7FAK5_DIAVI